MTTDRKPSLDDLHRQLIEARARHSRAQRAVQEANRDECVARNKLCDAMKVFDAAVAEMRKAYGAHDKPRGRRTSTGVTVCHGDRSFWGAATGGANNTKP